MRIRERSHEYRLRGNELDRSFTWVGLGRYRWLPLHALSGQIYLHFSSGQVLNRVVVPRSNADPPKDSIRQRL